MADIGNIVDQNAAARVLSPKAVAVQVGLMSLASLVTVVVFSSLRPRHKRVYEPKIKYHVGDKRPPRISSNFFGWISPLINVKEPDLVDKAGLDAATFLRFLRLFRWLFTAIAILSCGVLIPVNLTYNLKNRNDLGDRAKTILDKISIQNVGGTTLYVHVAVTYLITFISFAFVWLHWKNMVRLRQLWFRSSDYQAAFYARTLLISKVPKKNQTDDGLRHIYNSVQAPYATTSVHISHRVGKLPELVEYHNATVRELDQTLVRYLKGGKIGKRRPTIRHGGFLGLGVTKTDAIEFYTAKLRRTEAAIEDYRKNYDQRKAENYGFASMAAVPYAHVVARMLRGKHPKGTTIELAPPPSDIIWENMNKTGAELASKKLTGFFLLLVVCFFNTIPLFVISVLANISTLAGFVSFLGNWQGASSWSFDVIAGVLPPAVSAFFGYFLPIIMRWLSQYQGALTYSRLDRAVVGRYFAFLVISQLVIFTLIGVFFNLVDKIIKDVGHHMSFADIIRSLKLKDIPSQINDAYISQSTYWLTFFPLRGFLVFFDLAQIINFLWVSLRTRLRGRTPRDISEACQPPEFQYAIYYSNMLFMAAVGIVFAPLVPIVAVAAAVVFWVSSWVYKYQLMFAYTTKVETGGRLWNVVINRFLVTLILMQALLILTLGLQHGFKSFTWVSMIPPMVFVLIFKGVIDRKFNSQFGGYIPTEDDIRSAKVHSERTDNTKGRLEKRFGHPALHAEIFIGKLHDNMIPLLSQVYNGNVAYGESRIEGGRKVQVLIVPGGVKFAGIAEDDLEFDPSLYRREHGEGDWDTKSMASTNVLGDGASLHTTRSEFYAGGRSSPAPPVPNYNSYLGNGPAHINSQSEIELSRFDSRTTDQQPLLPDRGYFDNAPPPLPHQSPHGSPRTQYPPQYPSPLATYRGEEAYRQAPLHRPYASNSETNVAGRGTQEYR